MRKKPSWITERPIAHRGLHSNNKDFPENSLKAFENAILNNYPIELDVHLTADNRVVVFHDDDLVRMCGVNFKVNELTATELKKLSLLESDEKIPLLDEVLNLVDARVPILIELKTSKANKKIHEPLFEVIEKYKGEVAIQSFDPFLLKWFVRNAPSIPRGQLSGSFKGEKMNFLIKRILRNYFLNFLSKPDFIAHEFDDSNYKTVKKIRAKNTPVLVWTIRSSEEWKDVSKYCDNIIFENFKPRN